MNADYDAFLADPCYCGHPRSEHRRGGSVVTGHCQTCRDSHYFEDVPLHERLTREAALQADPNHVHGTRHTAYACPGFIPFQVCDECGAKVR